MNFNGENSTAIFGEATIDGDLEVKGDGTFENITVNDTATINTLITEIELEVEDPLILMGKDNPADTNNLGLKMEYDSGGKKWAGIIRSEDDKNFYLYKDATTKPSPTSDITVLPKADLKVNKLYSSELDVGTNWNISKVGAHLNVIHSGDSQFYSFRSGGYTHQYSAGSGKVGVEYKSSNGTISTPTATTINNTITELIFSGHNGTDYNQGGTVQLSATENWSTGNNGTKMFFEITPNGESTRRNFLEINENYLQIGDTIANTYYQLPSTRGNNDDILISDGSGVLSWTNKNPFNQSLNDTDNVQFTELNLENTGGTIQRIKRPLKASDFSYLTFSTNDDVLSNYTLGLDPGNSDFKIKKAGADIAGFDTTTTDFYLKDSCHIGSLTAPNSKAILELTSTGNNKGFLLPRLTTAQKTAISAPIPNGLTVYDTDNKDIEYYDGTQWKGTVSGNPFDQLLNTSSSPSFVNLTATGTNITLDGSSNAIINVDRNNTPDNGIIQYKINGTNDWAVGNIGSSNFKINDSIGGDVMEISKATKATNFYGTLTSNNTITGNLLQTTTSLWSVSTNEQTFGGTSGKIRFPANQALALRMQEGNNDYIVFNTTTGAEKIEAKKTLDINTTTSQDNISIVKSNSSSSWKINAGRTAFFDNWLLLKNSGTANNFELALTNTGSLRARDASAGSPAYGFENGSNYGMYFTTNNLNFSTAGIRRLWIDNNGETKTSHRFNSENSIWTNGVRAWRAIHTKTTSTTVANTLTITEVMNYGAPPSGYFKVGDKIRFKISGIISSVSGHGFQVGVSIHNAQLNTSFRTLGANTNVGFDYEGEATFRTVGASGAFWGFWKMTLGIGGSATVWSGTSDNVSCDTTNISTNLRARVWWNTSDAGNSVTITQGDICIL